MKPQFSVKTDYGHLGKS